jgi:hypothetical protein
VGPRTAGYAASTEATTKEMTPSSPPQVYAEWLPLLDRFRDGDDSVLTAMRQGCIEWTNVVAERWTNSVSGTLTARLQGLQRQLQLALNRARTPFDVSRALLDARRGLVPLRALATIPCAPEEVRNHLTSELDRFIDQTQNALEKGARDSRSGGGAALCDNSAILKAIRDNPLTAPVTNDLSRIGLEPEGGQEPIARGRRVIL